MPSGAPAFLFHLGEIRSFIPVRFRIIVERDGIETRAFRLALRYDHVGHADDRRRIPPAAEFGKYRRVTTEPALNGFGKRRAEMLLIFGVASISNCLRRIEVPEPVDLMFSGLNKDRRRRRNGANANVRRKTCRWITKQPAGHTLFRKLESSSCEQDERIQSGAPRDVIFLHNVVKMANADWISREEQGTVVRVPNGERPVTYQLSQALGSPSLEGSCNNFHIGRIRR